MQTVSIQLAHAVAIKLISQVMKNTNVIKMLYHNSVMTIIILLVIQHVNMWEESLYVIYVSSYGYQNSKEHFTRS